MALEGKAVVIVGMCRSGTSSVAGALAKLGVYFGQQEHLYQGDKHNEGGYWEHKAVNAAHRKFHLSLNLAGLDVDPLPEDWRERPMTESMVNGTSQMLQAHFSGRPIWGWKDPQASTLLPFVNDVFDRSGISPVLILCVRNPIDVAASQKRRQGSPATQTLGGWLLSTLATLRDSKGMFRTVVMYSSFLQNPRPFLEPVAKQLEIKATDEQWRSVIDWVRPELSHGADRYDELSGYPEAFKKAFDICQEAANDPVALNQGAFDDRVESLWAEWLTWHDLFSRPPFPEASFNLSWERAGERQIQETAYRPVRNWQVIKCPSRALPGSRVSVLIYPLPAIAWIRKAVWKQGDNELPAKLLPGQHGQLDEQSGFQRVWLFYGFEQIAVEAPIAKGAFELEMEVLIETSNIISGMTYQDLTRRAESQK